MGKQKNFCWDEAFDTCMPIILKLASQYASIPSSVVDRDDLINCGLIGLMEAHKKYSKNKNTKFSTFAYFRIRGAMLDEIRKYQPHKRNVMDKHKKIQQAKAKVLQFPVPKSASRTSVAETSEQGHDEQAGDQKRISQLSGFSSKEIDRVAQIISIRRANSNVEDYSKEDNNPESIAQDKQRKEALELAVSKLNPTERNVINFRFHRELRLKEIGKRMNLSEARIHQLEKTALIKLKDLVREEDRESAA